MSHQPLRPFNSVGNNKSPEAINANLAILQPLFPQFDKGLLYTILQEKKNTVQDAIEALLEMCSEKPLPPPVPTTNNGNNNDFQSFNPVWYRKDDSSFPPLAAPAPRNPRASSFVKKPNTRAQQRRNHRNNKNKQPSITVNNKNREPTAFVSAPAPATADVDATIQFSQLQAPSVPAVSVPTNIKPYATSAPIPIPARVECRPLEVYEVEGNPVLTEASSNKAPALVVASTETIQSTDASEFAPELEMSTVAEDNGFVMLNNNRNSSNVSNNTEKDAACIVFEPPSTPAPAVVVAAAVPDLQEQQQQPRPSISVKLCNDSDMRRIGIPADDPDAFSKLKIASDHFLATSPSPPTSASASAAAAPKYRDEEGDLVAVHSQEEWEECVRVHESVLWQATPRPPRVIRLVF
eukprot:TRINITY_DN47_c0_g1_i3.p1 TRINITY_DN47_c0_g1~~TRINITY_DN47_c0_g1_i3.p1  ORF type:complete len:408 (+),score=89.05 TRINITY_DN47_c0_g1_i3:179-1402(+)